MTIKPFSTKIFRGHYAKKPAVELCPKLMMKDIEADLHCEPWKRKAGQLHVAGRLDATISVIKELRGISLQVVSRCHITGGATNRTIDLAPSRSKGGGISYRFQCPGSDDGRGGGTICGSLVKTLYLVERPGQEYFACFFCHKMTHLSTQRGNYHKPRAKRATGKPQENPPVPTTQCQWIPTTPAPANREPSHA
jgi:hypothetical protein